MKISENDIKNWRENPSGKGIWHADELSGFYVREFPSGELSYYLRVRDQNGHRIQTKIAKCSEMSPGQARSYAKSVIPKIKVGGLETVKTKPSNAHSLTGQQIFEKWKVWAEKNPGLISVRKKRYLIENWGAYKQFYDLRIGELSLVEIENNLQKFFDRGLKAVSVNRYITELRSLVYWAENQGLIDADKNHWKEVKRFKELDSVPKTDHFTDEERRAIRKAAEEKSQKSYFGHSMAYIKPLVEILLLTGIRPGSHMIYTVANTSHCRV